MNETMPNLTPQFVLDLVIRRRWTIMIPFSLALAAGIYLAIVLPKTFESKTLILVEAPRVPQNYVRSIVTTDTAELINTISQQITSQTNLEKIIQDFRLFNEPEARNMFIEDKVADLRSKIKVDVISGRGEAQAFTISFRGKDPRKVMNVTNALASYFIDENLKVRESRATGTSEFLDSQLESMRKRLEQLEKDMKDYRTIHMGELPEQLQSNLSILGRLQDDLTSRQQNLREAKIRLSELNNQAMTREPAIVVIGGDQRQPEGTASLEQLKSQLEAMQARYTPQHPDVIRLKTRIAELESKAKSDSAQSNNTAASAHIPAELRQQLADAKRDIQVIEGEIEVLKNQIATYQKRIEDTPKREQELLGLRRDYDNIKTTYDSLLARKLEADIAVNLERKQKGEQFRVVDPATEAQRPVEPDMRKLFLMAVAAGLGIGGGLAFLLETLKPTFRKPEEIERQCELPVLTSIPSLLNPRHILLGRLNMGASICFLTLVAIQLAAFGIVIIKGVEPAIALARKIMGA